MRVQLRVEGADLSPDLSSDVVYIGQQNPARPDLLQVNMVGESSYRLLSDRLASLKGKKIHAEIVVKREEASHTGRASYVTRSVDYQGLVIVHEAEEFSEIGQTVRAGPGDSMVALALELLEFVDVLALRQRLGLSLAELASRVNVSRAAVAQWESGATSPPKDVRTKLRRLVADADTAQERRAFARAVRQMSKTEMLVSAVPHPGVPKRARLYIIPAKDRPVAAYQYLDGSGWLFIGVGYDNPATTKAVWERAVELAKRLRSQPKVTRKPRRR